MASAADHLRPTPLFDDQSRRAERAQSNRGASLQAQRAIAPGIGPSARVRPASSPCKIPFARRAGARRFLNWFPLTACLKADCHRGREAGGTAGNAAADRSGGWRALAPRVDSCGRAGGSLASRQRANEDDRSLHRLAPNSATLASRSPAAGHSSARIRECAERRCTGWTGDRGSTPRDRECLPGARPRTCRPRSGPRA